MLLLRGIRDKMGNLSSLDGTTSDIVRRVLPFTEKKDGIALAESILARKPDPPYYSLNWNQRPDGQLYFVYKYRFE